MIKLLIASILIAALTACNNNAGNGTGNADTAKSTTISSMDTLTAQEQSEGWQLLFDGQTTKGWHKYGGAPAGTAWEIADGSLYLGTSSKIGGNNSGRRATLTDAE